MRSFYTLCLATLLLAVGPVNARTVTYEIDIDYGTINYTGRDVTAIKLNGGIPAPTIEAQVGDDLEITFHNRLDTESSIHWHGVLLPNDQDGVPHLTTQPIAAKSSFTFRYPVIHSGTYWYHSHTGLQEQRGVYGPIVFRPKHPAVQYDREIVMVWSDWIDENPDQVLANLKKDGDYYALKKGSVQSWARVLRHGRPAIEQRLQGAWTRMGPMDISDIGYDAFLGNGKPEALFPDFQPGDKVLVRMVNAGASSYFNVQFAGGAMTVVAADGVDVEPFATERLRMAIAETFDVLLTIPASGQYELRATANDGTGYASALLGSGARIPAPDLPKPNPFLMDHSAMGHATMKGDLPGHGDMDHASLKNPAMDDSAMDHSTMDHSTMDHSTMDHSTMDHSTMDHSTMDHSTMDHSTMDHSTMDHSTMDHSTMDHSIMEHSAMDDSAMDHASMKHEPMDRKPAMPSSMQSMEKLPISIMREYEHLRARQPTALALENPTRTVTLDLTGNMERYVWSFNNQTLSEADKILIRKGENVRFVLRNATMMHHPIHLHGHFFRVLNGQGDYAPLKHTVNVPPMDTVEIEFFASEDRDWFFHCHNLYHMKAGMARVISYQDTSRYSNAMRSLISRDNQWFRKAELGLQSQVTTGELSLSNTRNAIELEYDYNYDGEYDADLVYRRFISRFASLYAGGNVEQEEQEDDESTLVLGLSYTLPLLIDSDIRIDSEGDARLALGSELQISDRLKFGWDWNTDDEYRLSLSYELNKRVSLVASQDDEFDAGLGIRINY